MFRQFPQLETENLLLREIKFYDAKAIFQLFLDDEVTKYYDLETFTSISEAENLIKFFKESFEKEQGIRWGILKKDNDTIIGTCGFPRVWKDSLEAEIGYELAKAYWGKGIMMEALSAIIELGFHKLELTRIQATVYSENLASIKLLQKLGFLKEEQYKKNVVWREKSYDEYMFYLLKDKPHLSMRKF